MGYCVEIEDSKFKFKSENSDILMKKVKDKFIAGEIGDRWLDVDYILECDNIEDFFYELRLALHENNGMYYLDYFVGEKLGDYELELYSCIAEFVEDGYLEYLGEDGEKWRYVFEDGECKEVYPTINWE